MMLHTQQHQPTSTPTATTMIQRRSIATAIALQQSTHKERWPQILVGKLRLVKSTWSLSSAWSSDIPEPEPECPIIRNTIEESTTTTTTTSSLPPPPSYSDPSHPWAIEQQHEEEQIKENDDDDDDKEEVLPPYECTVSRVGHVHIKKERENQDKIAKKRTWRKLYVMLWGTAIRAYKREPKINQHGEEDKPIWSYTLQQAEAGLATDYRKHQHVLRIRIHNGPQFLFRCETERSAVLWIDAVQAATNICQDLDVRPMPEFSFGRRQRRNRRRQQQQQQQQASSS